MILSHSKHHIPAFKFPLMALIQLVLLIYFLPRNAARMLYTQEAHLLFVPPSDRRAVGAPAFPIAVPSGLSALVLIRLGEQFFTLVEITSESKALSWHVLSRTRG